MLKRSPSRSRPRGVKGKHVLQICLLLGVCLWLIYQVKHSHDKRKELDAKDAKISTKVQIDDVPKLGRKGLHPRVEEVAKSGKHKEDGEVKEEEDGEINHLQEEHEDGESKHEEEEDKYEENKHEDTEIEERGGGDDEMDEHEQEWKEGETDREEDFIDEEKEREDEENDNETDGKENEGREDEIENESLESQDLDSVDRSTHEAREEHYKADDASSEVAHDAQNLNSDAEKSSSRYSNENGEKSNDTSVGVYQNSETAEHVVSGNNSSLSVSNDERNDGIVSNSGSHAVSISSMTIQHDKQKEASNSSLQVTAEASVLTSMRTPTSSQPDATEATKIILDGATGREGSILLHVEPEATNNANVPSDSDQSSLVSASSNKSENAKLTTRESSNSSASNASGNFLSDDMTANVKKSSDSSAVKENTDTMPNNESKKHSESNENMNSDSSIKFMDANDSSSSSMYQNEKDVHTDLETLPKANGDNGDSVATE